MKNLFLPSLLLACTLILACWKETLDEYGLPEATQTGKGTFACLVNDEKWEPCQKEGELINCLLCPPNPVEDVWTMGGPGTNSVQMRFQRLCDSLNQSFLIIVAEIQPDLSYKAFNVHYEDYDNSICGSDDFERRDTTLPYEMKITRFDSGIISGTFNFILTDPGCTDTVRVTAGRFDYKI